MASWDYEKWKCVDCPRIGTIASGLFPKTKKRLVFYERRCVDCDRQWKDRHFRRQMPNLRVEMLHAYGNICNCCGEGNLWFLDLDHNGGVKVYRQSKPEWQRLKDLGWPKQGYQLLCTNCNFGKQKYGECPHSWSVV